MTEAIFQRRGMSLVPVDDQGRELLEKIKEGREVGCDIVRRRNPRHHRLYWAIVQFVQMHCPRFHDIPLHKIHTMLKLATGLVDTFIDAETGETFYTVRSIAWAAMDQSEFDPWFTEACKVIAHRWMPEGTTPEDVRKELLSMVDGPGAIGSRVA